MPFIDWSLACRLEMAHARRCATYTETQKGLHSCDQISAESVAGGYVCYAGDGSPLNRAIGVGFQGPVTKSSLNAIEQFYHSRNALSRIDICPLSDLSLLELLGLNRYRLEAFYSILVCALPEEVISVPLSSKVHVNQAKPSEAELWIKTVAQGFGENDVPSQETLDLLAPNFYSTSAICFLARIDDQPVGGGGIYIHDGVAEFGGTSTRPEFRRQGVQTALLLARLEVAYEQGCEVAMVVTSPGSDSQRNVERVGFRLAYNKAILVENKS